jgi:hypothetical protein
MKNNSNYLFLDTNILISFTKQEYFTKLVNFIKLKNFILVISSLTFVELHNEKNEQKPEEKERVFRICKLLSNIDFIISDYKEIWDKEINEYPNITNKIPIKYSSSQLPLGFISEEKTNELFDLFTNKKREDKIAINIHEWSIKYQILKDKWENDVKNIIRNALNDKVLTKDSNGKFLKDEYTKSKFISYLNLRFCDDFVKIKEFLDSKKNSELENYKDLSTKLNSLLQNKDSLKKLNLLLRNEDSFIMKGINITSLAFWYEYIVQNKKVHGSDLGDFCHITFIPYTAFSVLDKSRVDMFERIKKNENIFPDIQICNSKNFKEFI